MTTAVDPRAKQRKWDQKNADRKSNLGEIPKPVDPARRESCSRNLRLFLETYFAAAFPLKWSNDHLDVIEKTQSAVLGGGQFVVAMPRGSGKTTIHQRAAIWAINYGLSPYVYVVCADAKKAKGALRSIKTAYRFNKLLFEDFPEVCVPIRALRGIAKAAESQHVNGVPTLIDWTAECAQLPHVDGSLASGAMIGVGGITGAARGAQITLPDGEVLRPTLLLIDDFQTRESAASVTQCKTRLDTLTGDLMGMRGPSSPLAALATVTVIYQGDAADQLLDRKRYPDWHGVRKKMVYAWPTNESLWEQYAELRRTALRQDVEPTEATEYYRANREDMDAGSIIGWPERTGPDALSAIQHAYDIKIADPDAFESEYQNEPVALTDDELGFLNADQIAEKLNNLPKGEVPGAVQEITAAIDVQGNSLWWIIGGWGDGFTGYLCDYGVFPKQNRRFFNQRDLPINFSTLWPTLTEEEAIYKALTELVDELAGRTWKLANGVNAAISRLYIDEGYKDKVVHLFCKTTKHGSLVIPAKGFGVRASDNPMNERAIDKANGEVAGWNWRKRPTKEDKSLRCIRWDTNNWKTLIAERLKTQLGGNGCLSLWGDKPIDHRQLAQHLTAEFYVKTEGRGRTVIEWQHKPAKPDNHWLDGLAMCAVAASERGIKVIDQDVRKPQAAPLSLSDYAKLAGR